MIAHDGGVIWSGIEWAGTAERVVGRVLSKCVHWGTSAALTVAVGVAGVEWAVVMEH